VEVDEAAAEAPLQLQTDADAVAFSRPTAPASKSRASRVLT
jgi:hypothetical protein